MVDVQTEILIQCPIERVFEFSSDPDNAPKWYVNIKEAEWETPKPLQIGSRVAFKAKFLGRELSYTYEIVELVSQEKLVMRTAQGPFPMETTYEWTSHGSDATLMKLRNRGEPRGFSKVLSPFMASAMRRANHKDLRMLKSLLEG
jgi:uncharacterized protein YndB with AHSA1/START domain